MPGVGFAGHVHADAGLRCLAGGVLPVFGDAVGHQLRDAGVVADHQALEAPFVAQEVAQQPVVGGGGAAVQIAEGGHDAGGACLDARQKGRQIDIAQLGFRDIGGVVVLAAFAGAIAGEVLQAAEDGALAALVAAHHGRG